MIEIRPNPPLIRGRSNPDFEKKYLVSDILEIRKFETFLGTIALQVRTPEGSIFYPPMPRWDAERISKDLNACVELHRHSVRVGD